MNYQILMWLS